MKPQWTVIILTLASFSGCGLDGGGATLNDPAPSNGMILYQGTITGGGVTGTAQIYSVSGQIVVRLAGLQSPTDTRYFFFLEQGATTSYSSQVRGPVGSQNFYTGLSAGPTWTRVAFRGNGSTMSPEIAQAALTFIPP